MLADRCPRDIQREAPSWSTVEKIHRPDRSVGQPGSGWVCLGKSRGILELSHQILLPSFLSSHARSPAPRNSSAPYLVFPGEV